MLIKGALLLEANHKMQLQRREKKKFCWSAWLEFLRAYLSRSRHFGHAGVLLYA